MLQRKPPTDEPLRASTWLELKASLYNFLQDWDLESLEPLRDLNVLLLWPLGNIFISLLSWKNHSRPIFSVLAKGPWFYDTQVPSLIPYRATWSCPVSLTEKQSRSVMFPPPCFTAEVVFLGYTQHFCSSKHDDAKEVCLVSCSHNTFSFLWITLSWSWVVSPSVLCLVLFFYVLVYSDVGILCPPPVLCSRPWVCDCPVLLWGSVCVVSNQVQLCPPSVCHSPLSPCILWFQLY